jgi:tetratricopeptide (TPR) repeat protein
VEQSIAYFEDAIKRDPTFAPAYVGLADAYDRLGSVFVGAPPTAARQKQMSAARKALDLDPTIAEAHVLLADVLQRRWQWVDAEAEYRRALDLNPSDSAAHIGFAMWLLSQGHSDEAVAWAERARELDPLGTAGTSIGDILFQARHYDEAIRAMQAVVGVRPDDASAYWYLGLALVANDQPGEAIPVLQKALSVSERSPGVIGVLIRAYAHAGRRSDALCGLLFPGRNHLHGRETAY